AVAGGDARGRGAADPVSGDVDRAAGRRAAGDAGAVQAGAAIGAVRSIRVAPRDEAEVGDRGIEEPDQRLVDQVNAARGARATGAAGHTCARLAVDTDARGHCREVTRRATAVVHVQALAPGAVTGRRTEVAAAGAARDIVAAVCTRRRRDATVRDLTAVAR